MNGSLSLKKNNSGKISLKKSEVVLFFFGVLLLLYLVEQHGLKAIGNYISNTGWTIPIIIGVWFVIYNINTFVQLLLLKGFNSNIHFLQLLRITIVEFTLNDLIPAIAVGGEIYKLSLLSNLLDSKKAISFVAEYRIIHALGHFTFILFALILILVFAVIPATIKIILVSGLFIISPLMVILFFVNRKGFFSSGYRILSKSKLISKFLERHKLTRFFFEDIDRHIVEIFSKRKKILVGSILLEFFTRNIMVVELYFIMNVANHQIEFTHLYLIYIFFTFIANVFIFIPMNLGIRESGFYLLLGSLSFSPRLGIYLAFMMRIREFIWFAIGLLLIGFGNLRGIKK